MSLNFITLTGNVPGGAAGEVSAVISGWIPDATDEELIPPIPQSVNIASNGTFSMPGLLANDNPNIPAGTFWVITVSGISKVPLYSLTTQLNFANGATQDISRLAIFVPTGSFTGMLPLPSGTPAAGQVPAVIANGSEATQWTTPSGGVETFNGHSPVSGNLVPQSGDYTAAMVGAVATSALGAASGAAMLDANLRIVPAERDNVWGTIFTVAQTPSSLTNGTVYRFNCSGASVSQTLPTAPSTGTTIGLARTDTSASNTLSVVPGGTDTIPSPNPTSVGGGQTIVYVYTAGSPGQWNVIASNLPIGSLLTTATASTLFAPLGVPAYQGSANYAAGQLVVNSGSVYYANNVITGSPATFDPTKWTLVSTTSTPGPEDFGWVGWTMDPMTAIGATGTPAAGTVYLCAFPSRRVSTFTNVALASKVAPVLTGAAYYGVYSIGATTASLLSATADFHASWTTAGAEPQPLTTPQTNQPPAWYYAALLVVSGTTLPTIESATGSASFAQLANNGLTGSTNPPLRFAIGATGASVLPASITLSALTGVSAIPFGAIVY